jgi:adenylate cyclase
VKLRARFYQPWFGVWVGSILAVLLGLVFLNPFLGQGLTNRSYDLPFSFRQPKCPDELVIIYMDQESHSVLKQPLREPWDRALHARLIDRLRAEHSRVVLFDVLMDETNAVTDGDLAAAMRKHGKVVLGSQFLRIGDEAVADGWSLQEPQEPLLSAAAGTGVVEVYQDGDTTVRWLFPGMQIGPDFVPAVTWKAAEVEGVRMTTDPRQRKKERWVNYYGPPGRLRKVSYCRALNVSEVPAGYFSNKVVVVGASIMGLSRAGMDAFHSPYLSGGGPLFAGAEIHATILLNLLRGEWLRRFSPVTETCLLVVSGFLAGFAFVRFRPSIAAVLAVAAVVGITSLAFWGAWNLRIWFPWLIVVCVQIPVAVGWAVVFHEAKSYVAGGLLERSLALYLSPKQVANILKQPDLLKPGGVQQQVSILFSDIARFSKISERLDPEDLVKWLNQYYENAISCIHQTDGTVMNLLGDAIFAIWNAPQEQPDHQLRACRSALLLHEKVIEFDALQESLPLRTRVGLHSGVVCVGNIGSSTHFDYTAIGEAVNLAFRLEELNKHLETNILATRDILKPAAPQLVSRMVGHFRLKGFDHVVEVHELLGTQKRESPSLAWRESFAQGLHHFQRKSFAAAEEAFRATLALRPDDGPARFYLERIRELQGVVLPRDWAGEVVMQEK